ncbi:hypothetical protein [Yoonia sp. MH D7]
MLGEAPLVIPALRNTGLVISDPPNTHSDIRRVSAVRGLSSDELWSFCDTDISDLPSVTDIRLQREAVVPLALNIGFSEDNDVKLVDIRIKPMVVIEIEDITGPPDSLRADPSQVPNQSVESLRTAGWVNGTHAIFTSCHERQIGRATISCSYRILRRKDALEISFVGVTTKNKPRIAERNPLLVNDLLSKFDAVLEHYAATESRSD